MELGDYILSKNFQEIRESIVNSLGEIARSEEIPEPIQHYAGYIRDQVEAQALVDRIKALAAAERFDLLVSRINKLFE